MALTCCQQPDHSTLAAFVSSMKDEIQGLFSSVLLVCEELGLLGGSEFALDGLQLPSNASLQWSGKMADLQKKKEKIESRVGQFLEKHIEQDQKEALEESSKERRQRHIERLQKKAAVIEKFLQANATLNFAATNFPLKPFPS